MHSVPEGWKPDEEGNQLVMQVKKKVSPTGPAWYSAGGSPPSMGWYVVAGRRCQVLPEVPAPQATSVPPLPCLQALRPPYGAPWSNPASSSSNPFPPLCSPSHRPTSALSQSLWSLLEPRKHQGFTSRCTPSTPPDLQPSLLCSLFPRRTAYWIRRRFSHISPCRTTTARG